ncbi:hypothetical protein DSO57_1007770 [Entomophthora muscae]|uniref:Uncharacterized protein n=1 Tax=Entomophthora muscae TaxID=34485 RepID=A0ACC2UTX9_9FUNG|nr:hypothetical protein DSO57_1007770 [Entomophthora muscae]
MTPEELQRHYRQGLCFYCHEAGHLTRACPKKTPAPVSLAQINASSQSYKFILVKIDNSSPLVTQARDQDLNPGPGSLRAAGPMDRWAACLCFLGIKPLQAEAPVNSQSQNTDASPTIVAPKEEPLKLPNEGRDDAYVSFMSLKSSQVTNKEPTQERGTGLWPGPMTTTLKQDNQVAKSRFLTNEITPGPSAILLLSDPSTQFPRPSFTQCPDEPMENVKFGGGVLYRSKDPALQTYRHF